jgi:hypothetical protein
MASLPRDGPEQCLADCVSRGVGVERSSGVQAAHAGRESVRNRRARMQRDSWTPLLVYELVPFDTVDYQGHILISLSWSEGRVACTASWRSSRRFDAPDSASHASCCHSHKPHTHPGLGEISPMQQQGRRYDSAICDDGTYSAAYARTMKISVVAWAALAAQASGVSWCPSYHQIIGHYDPSGPILVDGVWHVFPDGATAPGNGW